MSGFPEEKRVADEIAQVEINAPHVFLLGAGASRAAFPNGDRNGKRLPVMADFVEILELESLFENSGIDYQRRNFEDIYSELCLNESFQKVRLQLEDLIFDYFNSLELPDTPTIYDYLVLSLRPKDVIATFNWDPFLIKAVRRCTSNGNQPRLVFLHGNVLQGYCKTDNMMGVRNTRCSKCGEVFAEVPLLYPISQKNYSSNLAISRAWEFIEYSFKHAFMVSVFGYGAPQSDSGAVELLSNAYGDWKSRQFEQFEMLDIRRQDELVESWSRFIHTHHYEIHSSFFDSWIIRHPRRSGEAWWNQNIQACFIEDNRVPQFESIKELKSWFVPLIEAEQLAIEN